MYHVHNILYMYLAFPLLPVALFEEGVIRYCLTLKSISAQRDIHFSFAQLVFILATFKDYFHNIFAIITKMYKQSPPKV